MSVGAYEAKTNLPRLLDDVERGASFVITKHGRPVARLTGVRGRHDTSTLVEAFARARAGKRLGMPMEDAIAEGRR